MRVLLTGGRGVIGKKIFNAFVEKNYNVTCLTRDICDLSLGKDVASYIAENDFHYDVLVHAAGINNPSNFENDAVSVISESMQVNYASGMELAKAALPFMIEKGFGRIVFLSSLWSKMGKSRRVSYAASKGALDSAMRTLAVEFGSYNILTNSVSPGFVDTSLTRKNLSEMELSKICSRTPTHHLVDADEISSMVCYLCSPENKSLNGQNITIDGGFSLSGDF